MSATEMQKISNSSTGTTAGGIGTVWGVAIAWSAFMFFGLWHAPHRGHLATAVFWLYVLIFAGGAWLLIYAFF